MTDPVIRAKTRVPSMRGLDRGRLDAVLQTAWDRPLTLVIAPAGSGKTTLLSAFARNVSGTNKKLAWYQAASSEADAPALLRHLEEAFRQSLPGLASGWDSVGAAAAALETWDGAPVALVVDDAHTLANTEGEAVLGQLIAYLPHRVHVILSSRRLPSFDLSRWRLADQVTEIGGDELRFRSWEVEELFVNHYRQRLRPEDLAELARRMDGWAVGLALFHLATRNKTPVERRRVLDSLSTRQRDTRDYLTRNVLAELDDDLRDFLVRTSILGRLSGPWCDALLERSDGTQVLAELERRHLFLVSDDEGITYRQHEVLRTHLEGLLVEQIGEAATRRLYQRAGPILEEGGAEAEALRAYCRAQDWVAADRLLGRSGNRVFDPFGSWVEPLPSALADHDAWLLLALARRQVRSGDWPAALGSYRRAEDVAGGNLIARTCQEERFQLAGWMDPDTSVAPTWTGLLRRALERDPLGAAGEMAPPNSTESGLGEPAPGRMVTLQSRLAAGFAVLAAGHLQQAASILAEAADDLDGDSVLGRWGAFAEAAIRRILGDREDDLSGALDDLDPIVPPWLGRLLRHVLDGWSSDLVAQIESARTDAAATNNPWIDLGLLFLLGFGQTATGATRAAVASLDAAAERARSLGTPVLTAWATAGASLAEAAHDRAAGALRAASAERLGRSSGCPGALALAALVVSATEESPLWDQAARSFEQDGVVQLSAAVARVTNGSAANNGSAPTNGHASTNGGRPDPETATTLPVSAEPLDTRQSVIAPLVEVRCLGLFELVVDGVRIDVGDIKPRLRSLLYRLALEAGRAVHRDQLRAALWPRDDPRTGMRNLHVAVSALRQVLEWRCGPGAAVLLARRGDNYVLELGQGACDLQDFETTVERGRRARRSGEQQVAVPALRSALTLYRGELLADEGMAEWILDERERFRLLAADTAQLLGECLLEQGDIDGAMEVAERGVAIDRYNDRLWRVLIEAHERNGNLAAAARSGRLYAIVLDELGVVSATVEQ